MKKQVHSHPPSHYNQSTTAVVVTHTHPGHPGAAITHPAPMRGFTPGYVPQYNPLFFSMQQQASNQHVHNHNPHVHGHDNGAMYRPK